MALKIALKKDSLLERVQESSRQLSVVAPTLNSASDNLGRSISKLEDRLKTLGLGISSWVAFSTWMSDDRFQYSSDEIGYTKTAGKWGFSIRVCSGHEGGDSDEIIQWSFNDAPREMRVRSISKIPDLLEKLIKDATEMAKAVSDSAEHVDFLTNALVLDPEAETKGKPS
jgi:hypothetical protein